MIVRGAATVPTVAADRLYYEYWQKLEAITDPTLVVQIPESRNEPKPVSNVPGLVLPGNDKEEEPTDEAPGGSSQIPKHELYEQVVVRVDYEVENPQGGAHFDGEFMHTNSEVYIQRPPLGNNASDFSDNMYHICYELGPIQSRNKPHPKEYAFFALLAISFSS
jgi:hypothetical protein